MSLPTNPDLLMAGGTSPYYNVQRSLRFRSSASAYLNRTPSVAGNRKTWTWSAWVKRGQLGARQDIFATYAASTDTQAFYISFTAGDLLNVLSYTVDYRITTQVFRDPSAWYHIVVALDSTNATASNRLKLYVNGNEITAFTTNNAIVLNQDYGINQTSLHTLGMSQTVGPANGRFCDCYLSEINFIDGQALTPSSFGYTDPTTGVWMPENYNGTYGTNGFYLPFTNTTNTTNLCRDASGNGNNWTPNNISLTAGVTYDSMLDVPTNWGDGGNGRGNYCVLNPLKNSGTILNGNLLTTNAGSSGFYTTYATASMDAGKFYYEITTTDDGVNARYSGFGIADPSVALTSVGTTSSNAPSVSSRGWVQYVRSAISGYTTGLVNSAAYVNTTTRATTSGTRTFMVAYDADSGKCWMGYEGAWWTGDPATGTSQYFTAAAPMMPVFVPYNDGSNAALPLTLNFGQRPFTYTPPSGFRALNTQNLTTPTIINGAQYMDATLYSGNGSSRTITGELFSPDFVWIKSRSGATDHALYDTVRGVQLQLESNTTTAETTESTGLTAFTSDGFTVGSLAQVNTNAATYVAWLWDESVASGFDIVTYTGNGANRTISHSLNAVPSMIIVKQRTASSTTNWAVYHSSLANTEYILLNTTGAKATGATYWNSTTPTPSNFSLGTAADVNTNTGTYVAYCFAPVAGYSAFGSYTGNGSADGPFVYCGFRPRYIMVKVSTGAGGQWVIWDTARDTYNIVNNELYAQSSAAESGSSADVDILSNGFKIRRSASNFNTGTETVIYAAFAENPFKISRAR